MTRERRCPAVRARRSGERACGPASSPSARADRGRRDFAVHEFGCRLGDETVLLGQPLGREDGLRIGLVGQPTPAAYRRVCNCHERSPVSIACDGQTRSKIPAAPIPPPTHISQCSRGPTPARSRSATSRLARAAGAVCLHPFENPRGAHPAADTHSHKPVPGVSASHFVDERRRELGAGASRADGRGRWRRRSRSADPDRSAARAGRRGPVRRRLR